MTRIALFWAALFMPAVIAIGLFQHTALAQDPSDLIVNVDDGGQSVVAGDLFTYTIDFGIAASSTVTAHNLSLTQTLSDVVAFQSCAFPLATTGICTPNAGGLTIAVDGEMQGGDVGQVQVAVMTSAGASGDALSVVEFSAMDEMTTTPLTSTHASVVTRISTPPALQIALDDGVAVVQPGDDVTYTVTLANNGDLVAPGVQITIMLPAGLTLLGASHGGVENPGGSGLIGWTSMDLNGHETVTRTVTVQVDLPLDEAISSLVTTAVADNGNAPVIQASDEDGVLTGALTGVVWHDLNGDGVHQPEEAGFGGVPVHVTGRGEIFDPQPTAADGSFRLASLGAGDYEIDLDLTTLAGYSIVTGASTPTTMTLTAGQRVSVDFGFARPATIGGALWLDNDGDGQFSEGQPLLSNIAITLTDSGGTAVGNAVTDAQGAYQFADLRPGSYHVQVDASAFPPGYAGTYEADGILDRDVNVTVQSGDAVTEVDFGFAFAGRLEGSRVWRDTNQNGVMDEDEPGLPGVQIDLVHTSDGRRRSTITDENGYAHLENLEPGAYQVAVQSSTWNPQTGVTADPDAVLDGLADITVIAGRNAGPLFFGYGPLDLQIAKEANVSQGQTGERVLFRLTYANQGSVDAGAVRIIEHVPANSTFDAGHSSPGWTCAGDSPAGTLCELDLGVTPVTASGTVTFSVDITDIMPAHINTLINTVTLIDLTPGFTDVAPLDNTVTITLPVEAAPALTVSQTDGGLRTEPGQTLIYTITFGNEGNQNAAGVRIIQKTPQNTHFDTSRSTPGWECADDGQAGAECIFVIGDLNVGDNGEIVFAATLESAMPVNVATIDAVVEIYDDGGASDIAAELTPVDATPDLVVTSAADVTEVAPGALLQYTITYTNAGNRDAIGVLLVHTVPDYTTFIPGLSSSEWDCPDGTGAGVQCLLTVGGLKATASGRTYFTVKVDDSVPPGFTEIRNSVVIAGSGIEQNINNNHSGGVIDVIGPSAIDLISFTVEELPEDEGQGLSIRWETAAERDSWGFYLHRSTSSNWESSVRISPSLIQAVGSEDSGAIYTFEDKNTMAGIRYHYWLQELELTGWTVIYGPIEGMVEPADNGGDPSDENRIYFYFVPLVSGP